MSATLLAAPHNLKPSSDRSGAENDLDKMKADGLFLVMSKKEVSALEKASSLAKTLTGLRAWPPFRGGLVRDRFRFRKIPRFSEARAWKFPWCGLRPPIAIRTSSTTRSRATMRDPVGKLFCTLMADAILDGKAEAEKGGDACGAAPEAPSSHPEARLSCPSHRRSRRGRTIIPSSFAL